MRIKRDGPAARSEVFLGLEAGGTRTVALARTRTGGREVRAEFGPANLRLLTETQLAEHFRVIAAAMPQPTALAIGMAGARTEADRARIRRAAAKVWPQVSCYATNDLETALMAAETGPSTIEKREATVRVLILSGTGSCCFGRDVQGKTVKIGGWGHVLGDKGSGFEIGLRALKAVVYYFDRDGHWPVLGQRLLRALQLNEPNDLIDWVQRAPKTEIAALAVEVFLAWRQRDAIATDILKGAAASLARDAAGCAKRLARPGRMVQFIMAGSVLIRQPRFAALVERELRTLWPRARVTPLARESAWGAVELARVANGSPAITATPEEAPRFGAATTPSRSFRLSPTETRHPRSMNLDQLSLRDSVALMLDEDAKIGEALWEERQNIEQAVRWIVKAFKGGGRLFYVGAGTSGRLGVLDASECPPTFRTEPDQVQGIIAGGQTALWSAVEGAEDDADAGARAVEFRGVSARDVVVGIAASGRTPFVWGALRVAKKRRARTILLCFNPHLEIARGDSPSLVIAPKTGPEILTGSTRLKAGTATKLVLNIFTTLSMVRLGKVLGNLMIDVKASNVKLRDRAVRIVRELTGADADTAEEALVKSDWIIKKACAHLGRR